MSEPFIGEIRLVGFTFEPRGWAFCDGRLVSIAQNTALFSLLGTTYGGNGSTNFALPDLRGRVAVGFGQGPGQPNVIQGETGGQASVTLTASQIPAHSHALPASTGAQTTNRPTNAYPAAGNSYSSTQNAQLQPTGASGGNQPHENRPPFLGMNYIIALEGIFPSRP
jgi:microcystin-dependent protein